MRYLLLILALAIVGQCAAALEFSACALNGDKWSFIITDLDTRKKSEWLRIGDEFHGLTLDSFDAERETLTLRDGEETVQIRLKESKAIGLKSRPRRDLRIGPVPDEIPVRDHGRPANRRIKDPKVIQRVIEILRSSFELRTGLLSLRSKYTHAIELPDLWLYNAATGEIGNLPARPPPREPSVLFLIRGDLRDEFTKLLQTAELDPAAEPPP